MGSYGLLGERGIGVQRDLSFHSISFPSEWGGVDDGSLNIPQFCFHSISFPSEWGVTRYNNGGPVNYSFHSISFPSEWGENIKPSLVKEFGSLFSVSIQLVSPASGETMVRYYHLSLTGT